jgi:hypothetical protein
VARVQWPAETSWTTPLPSAVFPNETLHVMAGFCWQPATQVKIILEAQGGDVAEVTLPISAQVTAGDAVARMAAARRLAVLPAEEARALAIRYQLASEHTSLVLVAERDGDSKSREIPVTVAVPQMLAAGWGGSAHAAAAAAPAPLAKHAYRMADASADMMSMPRLLSTSERHRGGSFDAISPEEDGTSFQAELDLVRKPLLAALATSLQSGGHLPTSMKELMAIHAIPTWLRVMLTREGVRQVLSLAIIIRAFLELLDRDAGVITFPPLDAETKRQVREARKSLEGYF